MVTKIKLAVLLVLLIPSLTFAAPGWQRDTTWTWSYDPPEDLVLTGFRMYQDGNAILRGPRHVLEVVRFY